MKKKKTKKIRNSKNFNKNTRKQSKMLGFIYLFLGIFTWATIELTVKLIQTGVTPIFLNFARMSCAAIVLFIYTVSTNRLSIYKLFLKQHWKVTLAASLLGLVLGQIIYLYGVTMTEASLAATIFSSNPILISSVMMLSKREKFYWKRLGGIILGFIGVLGVITEFHFQEFFGKSEIIGNILVFLGMSLWSILIITGKILLSPKKKENNNEKKNYNENIDFLSQNPSNNIKNKKTKKGIKKSKNKIEEDPAPNKEMEFTSLDLNTAAFFFAAIGCIPFLWWPGEAGLSQISSIPLDGWLGILYLGFITGGLGYVLFFKGLKLMEASTGINVFYFKPIIATILAFFILNEIPGIWLYIGIIIEIVAMILVSS